MSTDTASAILARHEIRNTEIRRRVLSVFLDAREVALSSQDIEEKIEDIDRVTLYRALRTFEDAGVIHQAIDGGPKTKYAYCGDTCTTHEHQHEHAHFRCLSCDTTTCMEMVSIPSVKIPNGYSLEDSQLILTGVCGKCGAK